MTTVKLEQRNFWFEDIELKKETLLFKDKFSTNNGNDKFQNCDLKFDWVDFLIALLTIRIQFDNLKEKKEKHQKAKAFIRIKIKTHF